MTEWLERTEDNMGRVADWYAAKRKKERQDIRGIRHRLAVEAYAKKKPPKRKPPKAEMRRESTKAVDAFLAKGGSIQRINNPEPYRGEWTPWETTELILNADGSIKSFTKTRRSI